MSSLTIDLPDSLADRLKQLAEKDKVNPEQFVVIAVAEKIASLATIDYLETRARRANLDDFEKILAKVPDVEPDEYDKIQ
jgi:predicted transcriptional regulator